MPTPRSRAAALFGRRVRDARIALGMSQEQIADLADMHVTNYGRVERGVANSELHTILRIATALGADPGTLVAGLTGEGMLPARQRAYSVAEFLAERRDREQRGRDGAAD